jgi:threonylcarbamoyladenosine tRNA methylthiotransferase MtaB
LHHTDIPRLRLSSLEPWDIDGDFFALWQDRRLLPHLHLPLQSGSDRILRLMARRTRRDSFRELAAAARAQIPDLNLSTDLIAGFPGETEADFQETLQFVEEVAFARLHAFTYSARPGTAAARMSEQVAKAVRKERTRALITLGEKLSLAFHTAHEGKTARVLWEMPVGASGQGMRWQGYTDNYIRVMTYGPADLFNQVTDVRLHSARPDGMDATLLPA